MNHKFIRVSDAGFKFNSTEEVEVQGSVYRIKSSTMKTICSLMQIPGGSRFSSQLFRLNESLWLTVFNGPRSEILQDMYLTLEGDTLVSISSTKDTMSQIDDKVGSYEGLTKISDTYDRSHSIRYLEFRHGSNESGLLFNYDLESNWIYGTEFVEYEDILYMPSVLLNAEFEDPDLIDILYAGSSEVVAAREYAELFKTPEEFEDTEVALNEFIDIVKTITGYSLRSESRHDDIIRSLIDAKELKFSATVTRVIQTHELDLQQNYLYRVMKSTDVNYREVLEALSRLVKSGNYLINEYSDIFDRVVRGSTYAGASKALVELQSRT